MLQASTYKVLSLKNWYSSNMIMSKAMHGLLVSEQVFEIQKLYSYKERPFFYRPNVKHLIWERYVLKWTFAG